MLSGQRCHLQFTPTAGGSLGSPLDADSQKHAALGKHTKAVSATYVNAAPNNHKVGLKVDTEAALCLSCSSEAFEGYILPSFVVRPSPGGEHSHAPQGTWLQSRLSALLGVGMQFHAWWETGACPLQRQGCQQGLRAHIQSYTSAGKAGHTSRLPL